MSLFNPPSLAPSLSDNIFDTLRKINALLFSGAGGGSGGGGGTPDPSISTISLAANTSAASLTVAAGTITKLIGPGNRVLTVTTTFSVAVGAVLDIGNNHLVLKHATGITEAALQAMVNDGRLVCQKSKLRSIGILDNADFQFDNDDNFPWTMPAVHVSLDLDDIIVAWTLWGDCTFDDVINSDDNGQVTSGFFAHSTKWVDGNFRYLSTGTGTFDLQTFTNAFRGDIDPSNHDSWVSQPAGLLSFGSISGGSTATGTMGGICNAADTVVIVPTSSYPDGIIFTAIVTSAGTITIKATNATLGPITVDNMTFTAKTTTP